MSAELPRATGTFGDKPQLHFPQSQPPSELLVHVLEQGEGPVVQAGQTIEVNYLGQVWAGEVFDNSYDRGSTIHFPIGVGVVIAGWDSSLVGQPIGSRLLVNIPPHEGYGPGGVPQAGIGGEDVLVFVVDIVNAS